MTAPADKHETHQEHPAQAAAAIAEGNEHIAKQRAIMARLQARGHDLSEATALLETFLTTQKSHEEHRATILKELDEPTIP